MSNEKEIRSFNFEIRAEKVERGNIVTGLAIVYDSPYDNGSWTEYIDRGALENCDLRDVRLLVNHNTDMIPLARSRNNTPNSTMQLRHLPEKGLEIEALLDTERNSDARTLYSATERGDISGMSFMFVVDEDKWEDLDTEHPTRHIRSIKRVLEVSAVTFPCYEATTFENRDVFALESADAVLESAKHEYRMKVEAEQQKRREIERQKQRIRILADL